MLATGSQHLEVERSTKKKGKCQIVNRSCAPESLFLQHQNDHVSSGSDSQQVTGTKMFQHS